MVIVQVAIHIPLMHAFDYQLPKNIALPSKGCRVVVPFCNRTTLGIVLSNNKNSKFNHKKLKTIKKVLDKESLFSDSLWSLLLWGSQYYHYPIGEVLFHALPVLLRQGKTTIFPSILQWQITQQGKDFPLNKLKRSPKQQQALALLKYQSVYRHQIIENKLSENALQTLKKKL